MQPSNPGSTTEIDAERVERERIRRLFGRTDMRKRGEMLAAMIAARNQKGTTRKRPHPAPEPESKQEPSANEPEITEEERAERSKQRKKDIKSYRRRILYSSYYTDDEYQYRHVILPQAIARHLPHFNLLSKEEWYELGVRQTKEWEHYMVHAPEPHILLFRRPISCANKVLQESAEKSRADQTTRVDAQAENEEIVHTEDEDEEQQQEEEEEGHGDVEEEEEEEEHDGHGGYYDDNDEEDGQQDEDPHKTRKSSTGSSRRRPIA
ncbi:Cyclin-dependent kinases regulatory subunit 2 [Apophysomyces ossiformis]|uniref:Cyclin-dependent kinases regulatory subunit n=1 Tax=Apophysomyces ossiformis TaxID=679940 RepID=A0A8H7ELV3_9FUNG|nr:Cyclin-dependent kinases regulatory subunit 2 [Apophysomyces ossiformis]